MDRVIFSIIWIIVATGMSIGLYLQEGQAGLGRIGTVLVALFPFFGVWILWDGVRRLRRRRSVRRVQEHGGEVYVWTEFDGSERRSHRDPRDAWDAADRDEDGGGDGGGD
ncbi:MAG: hypothetical protein AAGB05_01500 [Pseudomonadota bacterium]